MSRGGNSLKRVSLASLVALAGLLAVSASSAAASVTIGQTFTPTEDFGESGVFIQSTSLNDAYVVPSNGVITSWSFEAAAGVTPPMKLKMVRSAGGSDFTTVGDSQLETPTPGTLNTWPTRIAVKAGDLPAHFYSDTTFSFRPTAGFVTEFIFGIPGTPGIDPPAGTTTTYEPGADEQIDLSAVLEPDADNDGFGDETQDQCSTNASTQGPCPVAPAPHKKKCKKKKKHHKADASAAKKKCKKKHH